MPVRAIPRAIYCAMVACSLAVACKAKAPPPVEAPPPTAPEPGPSLWFDEGSGPEMGAAYEQLSDAHFAEYPGLKAPPLPVQRLSTAWTTRAKIELGSDGRSNTEEVAQHCLDYAIAGADISLYADFEKVAKQRGDKVQHLDGALSWSRERPPQSAEMSSKPTQNTGASQPLQARWCTDYPAAAGREKMAEHMASDWRFAAAIDFANAVGRPARGTRYGREADTLAAGATFSLETPAQVDAARAWLSQHELTSDAMQLRWATRVGVSQVAAEVTDWSLLPMRVEITVRTPSASVAG